MKKSYEPDPKPAKRPRKQIRIIDKNAGRRKLLRDPSCRGEKCQMLASEGHHIVRKGSPHFGDDVEENILPLCLFCHHDWHAGRKPKLQFKQEEYDYVFGKLGEISGMKFLEDHYGKVASGG